MKTRPVVIFSGQRFDVPQCIQRIDTRSTHGWQVRYQGTKMFSDHSADGSGAADALALATAELKRRIARMPAPSKLQQRPSGNKTSDLPVGISGPIVRLRSGSQVRTAVLSVLMPRWGKPVRCSTVYIGTENTYTPERYLAALERAVAMRREAEEAYRVAETKARRAEGRAMLRQDAATKAADKPAVKASAKTSNKPAAKPAAKSSAKSPTGSAARSAGHSAGNSAGNSAGKPPAKAASRKATKTASARSTASKASAVSPAAARKAAAGAAAARKTAR